MWRIGIETFTTGIIKVRDWKRGIINVGWGEIQIPKRKMKKNHPEIIPKIVVNFSPYALPYFS
ncbi:MAG: hypothetical protein ACW96S_02070 [Promethearchaeota archaeon]|jgi:hypothetical protein